MSYQWKWSFWEAFSIILKTYAEDFGGANKSRAVLLDNPNITKIEDENITGLQAGSGQTVIFIHGTPGNALRWSQYISDVPKGYHFISIDRLGFGARSHNAPDIEHDFEVLLAFCKQFENLIIVGHSLGGAKALRLASSMPIVKLILVAASIDPALERVMAVQHLATHPLVSWMFSRSIRHSNAEMFQLQAFMERSEEFLSHIKAPVYFLHAKDDKLVPFTHLNYAKKHLKNLHLMTPDTGGHALPWNNQKLVIEAITSTGLTQEEAA